MKNVNSKGRRKCYKGRNTKRKSMSDQTRNAGLLKPYQMITDRIVELLERGVVPWRKPWSHESADPRNLASGKSYRGINTFVLEATAAAVGYRAPYWLTFRQALERGGNVRKGERATPVVFWKILRVSDGRKEEEATAEGRTIPLLKFFHVFNVEQCDGIAYPQPDATTERPFDPIIECERIMAAIVPAPNIVHREPRAFYSPASDLINMPRPETFVSAPEYFSTLFHECVHWCGVPSRLNRKTLGAKFGTTEYAREELIAEMGAAFLCGRAGISPATIDNAAAYIQSWLGRLRGDPKLVVLAAASAQRAADFILGAKVQEATHDEPSPAAEAAAQRERGT